MTHALRTALIGHGYVGRTFHAPLIHSVHGLALALIASSQTEVTQARWPHARVTADYMAAATDADVDLVVIATPNDSHYPLAAAALTAGKHVVIDKPFTVTLDEATELVRLARTHGRLLSVFHNRRWDGDFLSLRQAIGSGRLGAVRELVSRFDRFDPLPRDRWRERAGPGAGLWYDLGPHLVDQAVALFGVPDSVEAALRVQRPGGQVDDWFHVRLDYPTRQVLLTSSMLAADAPLRFLVRGTGGSLTKCGMDQQERRLMAGERPGQADWGVDPEPLVVLRDGEEPQRVPVPPGDYGRYYAAMRDAIHAGGPPPVSPAEALTVMAIIEAGIQSSETGRAVPLTG